MIEAGGVLLLRARCRPTSGPCAPARRTTRPPTSGCQRHEDLGDERWDRGHPRRDRRCRPRSAHPRPGQLRVPPGTKGLSQGQKFLKHGIRASHTAEVVLEGCRIPGRCLLGGKDKLDARLAKAREGGGGSSKNASMATFERTRPGVGAQAVGIARAAYEVALSTPRRASSSASRSSRTGHRLRAGRHEDLNRRLAAAGVARCLDGPAGQALRGGGGIDVQAVAGETAVRVTEKAIQILGGNGYTREYPVERMARDAKITRSSRAPPRSSGW